MSMPYVMINTMGFFPEINNMQQSVWLPSHLGAIFCSSTSCNKIREPNKGQFAEDYIGLFCLSALQKPDGACLSRQYDAALCAP